MNPQVEVFTEVFTDHAQLAAVRQTVRERLEAAGCRYEDAVWGVHYQHTAAVFVCIATVIKA